jgi:hypothetical protein
MESGVPRDWTPVLDVHPTAFRPDPPPEYAWLKLAFSIRHVSRQFLEFRYDPSGCALTDEELGLFADDRRRRGTGIVPSRRWNRPSMPESGPLLPFYNRAPPRIPFPQPVAYP